MERSPGSPPPRWLIVVQRDKREVYEDLRHRFELDERVEVILDRRHRDRREASRPMRDDRRGPPRRQPLPATELAFAQNAGFFLIVREGGGLPSPLRT